jgi:hypothetical protein
MTLTPPPTPFPGKGKETWVGAAPLHPTLLSPLNLAINRLQLGIILCFLFSFMLMSQAWAENFVPKFSDSVKYFGEGVFYAPKTSKLLREPDINLQMVGALKIYREPDENSQIVEIINWDDNDIYLTFSPKLKPSEATITFVPSQNIVLFAVLDDCKDWCKIVYNQTTGDCGWVKLSEEAKFYDWKDLFNKYGRKNGMYVWANTPKENQVLRTEPDVNSTPNNDFIYPKMMTLQMLRGNWMLIKVVDMGDVPKIGWFQWRTAEGKLLLFPKLTKPSN